MTLLHRMLAPSTARPTYQIGAAVFKAAPGVIADVDQVASKALAGEGWVELGLVGDSNDRPSPTGNAGLVFIAHGTNAVAVSDGATWRSPADASSV
jgi:hypothetical protein